MHACESVSVTICVFLIGSKVYAYDPKKIGQQGCCEYKELFIHLYPMAVDSTDVVTGNVDAVYRSFYRRSVFMFIGENVYENKAFRTGVPGMNQLVKLGPWYNRWYDICDPRPQT